MTTSDPVTKALLLQEKALKRSAERQQEEKMQKAMLWHRVKNEAPEIADFLTEINRVFGKPAKVDITFRD